MSFFAKVWMKLLDITFKKGMFTVVTKFNNQSHTHNLYRWPPQHAIASYSTEPASIMSCTLMN
jgi:hypothetical protein